MTQINTGACAAYTPKQMYDLVNDAEAYPRYLPLCSEVAICSEGADRRTATITLAKGKIKLDFTTANVMEDGKRIDMDLVDGPFKYPRGTSNSRSLIFNKIHIVMIIQQTSSLPVQSIG